MGRLTVGPSAATGAAVGIHSADATLAGSVTARSQPTTYHFDWGLTSAYGASTPETSAGSEASPLAITSAVAGLAPSTVYHFRIVATNGAGTTAGVDGTFTTAMAPVVAPLGLPPATRPISGGLRPSRRSPEELSSNFPAGRTTRRSTEHPRFRLAPRSTRAPGPFRLTDVRDRSGKLQTATFWSAPFVVVRPAPGGPRPSSRSSAPICGKARLVASVLETKAPRALHLWAHDNARALHHTRPVGRRHGARNNLVHAGKLRRDAREGQAAESSRYTTWRSHRTVVIHAWSELSRAPEMTLPRPARRNVPADGTSRRASCRWPCSSLLRTHRPR